MEYIKGFTFSPFSKKGSLGNDEAYKSLEIMKNTTNSNFVIFAPCGLQKTAHSEEIIFDCERNVTDDELKDMVNYAHKLGLRTALKPTVNCLDGTWRAHINFFDEDVVCEPKWSNWFASYTKFQLHYAKMAQELGCEMFIAGCEMVNSERREAEWRKLIADIKQVFSGLVSYNTDKYQEHNVKWWDCVDVISSSGYYPIDDWQNQLDRIEKVVKKFNKPFFFAETGCMATTGSNQVPNDWGVEGDVDLQGQADWYEEMFKAIKKRDWVEGCALWSWSGKLYDKETAKTHRFYEVYEKPAQEVIARNFE